MDLNSLSDKSEKQESVNNKGVDTPSSSYLANLWQNHKVSILSDNKAQEGTPSSVSFIARSLGEESGFSTLQTGEEKSKKPKENTDPNSLLQYEMTEQSWEEEINKMVDEIFKLSNVGVSPTKEAGSESKKENQVAEISKGAIAKKQSSWQQALEVLKEEEEEEEDF